MARRSFRRIPSRAVIADLRADGAPTVQTGDVTITPASPSTAGLAAAAGVAAITTADVTPVAAEATPAKAKRATKRKATAKR